MKNFLIGLSVGVTTGLLCAPYSGRKTRERITDTANSGAAFVKDHGDTVFDFIEQRLDDITRQRRGLAEAIRRGTDAYKRAVVVD